MFYGKTFKNERRRTVYVLRVLKGDLAGLIADWDVPGQVYIPQGERVPGEPYLRPRQRFEYPENRTEAWRALAKRARSLAGVLNKLAAYADEQAELVVKTEIEEKVA